MLTYFCCCRKHDGVFPPHKDNTINIPVWFLVLTSQDFLSMYMPRSETAGLHIRICSTFLGNDWFFKAAVGIHPPNSPALTFYVNALMILNSVSIPVFLYYFYSTFQVTKVKCLFSMRLDSVLFFFKILFIYSWGTRERGRDTGRGSSSSSQEAQCGSRSWDPRIMPGAEGRRLTAEPARCPDRVLFSFSSSIVWHFLFNALGLLAFLLL